MAIMAFNPDQLFNYILRGITLQTIKNAKYLGVNISDDLSWNKHISQISAKGNGILKFIKPNVQTFNSNIKEMAYKIYVRPLLEYSSSVWSPWQKNYIQQLEMIQQRAVRYVLNDYAYTSSVTAMQNKLKLPTLETRRNIASLVMLYKIHNDHVRVNLPSCIKPSMRNRLSIPFPRINTHKYFFFPRTARLWNDLPPDILSSPDPESFRSRLFSQF